MAINQIVEQIIESRKKRLPLIQAKQEMLGELEEALDNFDSLKSALVDADGNVLEGRYKAVMDKYPEMAIKLNALSSNECRKSIREAMKRCKLAEKRFSRESINIAVIGKARVGKSEFLKSISNLSNYVIPAFSETDCTGAVSIIENKPGVTLEARLTFKTEEEIVAVVQAYLDKIIPDEEKRMVVHNLHQIRDLDLKEVDQRKLHGRQENNLIPYLAKFVEHYEEWSACVKQESLVLHDEHEIQTYVAQNNGKREGEGKKSFYKYLAVNTCEISCTFDYQEAGRITLVDTVGFEDNAIGIEDELIKVVKDKSDAVVFVLFPLDGAGGGVPAKIGEIYGKIEQNCRDKNLDKWLFWLINHAPGHPKTKNPREFCEQALRTLEINSWAGEIRKIIDVSDKTLVREEFLIPLLNTLMGNLDEIDELYLQDLRDALEAVRKEYNAFCMAAKKVMESELKNAAVMQPQMVLEIDKLFRKISARLNILSRAEKEKRDISCDKLEDKVVEILEEMKSGAMIPCAEAIKEDLLSDPRPATHYTKYCDKIRNEVTKRFADIDGSLNELVDDVKDKIADALIADDCGRLGRIVNPVDGKPLYEWLKDFMELLDSQAYPKFYSAFEKLYSFQFSVRGFLTYEVRACLDPLDPELTDIPGLIGENDVETVENIRFSIERCLIDVVDELERNLGELFKKPNRALFAVIKEFSDQIIYSEGVYYEWNKLYAENYPLVWAQEYRNMAAASAAFGEWENILKMLLEHNRGLSGIAAL